MALLRKLASDKDEDDEINSIVENINNVLSTRRGYGFFLHDFGLSDNHHLSSCKDIAAIIIDEIKENIEHFEPRVEVIEIVDVRDDRLFRLSFSIDCLIRENARPLKLFLDPTLGCQKVDS